MDFKYDLDNFRRKDFPYKFVGLGGTFDHLHNGHRVLLQTAFKLGKKVAIAMTTKELLRDKEFFHLIQPYNVREKNLIKYIEEELKILKKYYTIIPLKDPFGPAITDPDLEAHISSMETYKVALEINRRRIERGLNPLFLTIIPMVMDDQGERYSSTSIRGYLKESE